MARLYSLLLPLLLLPHLLRAQTGRLTGLLHDEHQQAMPFANVLLLSTTDSVLLANTTTDTLGRFALQNLPLRPYALLISVVGYQKIRKSLTLSTTQPVVALAPMMLLQSKNTLKEVVVEGRPPLMQVEGDKLIMNVAASATHAGLNGLEVLAKVPGVLVDRNTEQVTLRNQAPLIMLDGRPTHLTPEQLAQQLKAMRSDEIATIEVIQNPSARYEAAGTGGILNIRTKKAQQYGALYTVQAGGAYGYFRGFGSTPRHNESFTFSRRSQRVSVYVSTANNYVQTIGEQRRTQTLLDETGQATEQRTNLGRSRGQLETQQLTANTEWYLTPRSTLSVQAQHTWSHDQYNQQLTQHLLRPTDSTGLDTDYTRVSRQRYLTVGGQFEHRFDTLGRQLTVALDGARVSNTLRSAFAYRAYPLAAPAEAVLTTNQINNPYLNPIYTGKLDYVHPAPHGQRWELGAQVSLTNNRNTFGSDFVGGQLRKNYFRFREIISAAYAQWSGNWHTYKLQAGLRAEQTSATGYNQQAQAVVRRSYLNAFPSASVARSLGAHQQLTLAYSRRIDRPNYQQFSPFQRFTSRLEYFQGNPQLRPYITNSFSLRHVWKDAIVTTFSYNQAAVLFSAFYTLDATTIPGETLLQTTFVNTRPRRVAWYNLNGTVPLDPARWLHLDISYWYTRQVYQNQVVTNYIAFDTNAFGGEVAASFTLPKEVVLEVAADANSGYNMGAFERSRPATQVNFGVRKTFAQKRGTLKLNLSDPFDLYRYNVRINSPELQAFNQSRGTNRLLRLQLTYNFGNNQARTSSRTPNSQENTSRSGSGAN
ncbi:outer membrane beta-barrel protein [Hymenobacter sp.]|jgi:hypothetical protein|uniref:outer membrane beta-barrel protein n=1 Tax=Hymenobacter sp. TaxID=1898978 RepID=UPI002ED94947